MNSNGSGKRLEGFFTGKGFYIVLFLCAAVIGVSAWMMATGNETMAEDVSRVNNNRLENRRVETVIVTPQVETGRTSGTQTNESDSLEAQAPEISAEDTAGPEDLSGEVWNQAEVAEVAGALYMWPVKGDLERSYSTEALKYDVTMRDWRTHNGVDIVAPLGETVMAAHSGSVESIVSDDLYGTVVTIDHGDGTKSVYANLAELPAVSVGSWVEPGDVIGSVGTTALCEIGQGTHLHFAMTLDGKSADPLSYLPA